MMSLNKLLSYIRGRLNNRYVVVIDANSLREILYSIYIKRNEVLDYAREC